MYGAFSLLLIGNGSNLLMLNNIELPGLILLMLLFGGTAASANIIDFDINRAVDKFANNIFQYGISSARAFSEITYEDVRYDPNLETFFITGLNLKPYNITPTNDCRIFVGSISIYGDQNSHFSNNKFSIGMANVEVNKFCFPAEVRRNFALLDIGDLAVPRLELEFEHNYRSAATSFKAFGGIADLADINIAAELDYFSITANEEFPIAAKLREFEVTIYNKGIWEKAQKQLPPSFTNPEFAKNIIEEMLTPVVLPVLQPENAQELVYQISSSVADFLINPSGITVRTQVPNNLQLEINESLFKNPNLLYSKLMPKIQATHAYNSIKITPEIYGLISNMQLENFDIAEISFFADAVASGNGAPKNEDLAIELNQYLIANGQHSSFKKLMDLYVVKEDYAKAYFSALHLAKRGDKLAPSYLNRLEKTLTLEQIIQFQNEFSNNFGEPNFESGFEPYDLAKAYMEGDGLNKSYEKSYYWSLYALASGDQRATFLVTKLEAIKEKLSDDKSKNWQSKLIAIRAEVTRDWLDGN